MDSNRLSRRDFARTAALAAAVAVIPLDLPAQEAPPPPAKPVEEPKPLSPASQAEAEARYQAILRKYGDRFTAAQKAEIRKSVMNGQKGLDALRAYKLDNADEPATILHVELSERRQP